MFHFKKFIATFLRVIAFKKTDLRFPRNDTSLPTFSKRIGMYIPIFRDACHVKGGTRKGRGKKLAIHTIANCTGGMKIA